MDVEALVDRTLRSLYLSHSAAERPCIFPPINPAAQSKEKGDPATFSLQEPSLQEPSLQELSLQEPSLQELSLQEPSLQEPSLQELSLQEPSLQEPSLQELSLQEHQRKVEDNKRLLEQLARIEEELVDSLRREVARKRQLNVIIQEDNRLRWRTLCFLQLNQRLKKPVVTSYYKNIPMHIYCLPIQTVGKGNSNRKNQKKWQR